jgi:hypothetical protein
MASIRVGRWLASATVAVCVASAGLAVVQVASRASAQSGDAIVKIVPPAEPPKKGGQNVAIDVTVENARNLAGFQFELKYNADIFEFQEAQKAEFLGSSGREVICNSPITDVGVVRFTCVTLRPEPLGPDGNGKLATIFLKPIGSGTTELRLDKVKLNQVAEGVPNLPTQQVNATIDVKGGGGGMNWLIWGPIIAIGALAVAGGVAFGAMKMRAGTGKTAAAV